MHFHLSTFSIFFFLILLLLHTAMPLHVQSYDPFAHITVSERVWHLLHTHQGRDKLFKVIMYSLRLVLWFKDIDPNLQFFADARASDFTLAERNLMTIQNTRRLFRTGRFVAEFVRLRVTLLKCSELLYFPSKNLKMALFLQSQMILDIVARVMMVIKTVCEDLAFLARKGFLSSKMEDKIMSLASPFYLPVLLIDLYLNTMRLAQGILDAQHREHANVDPTDPTRFSLLAKYDKVDRMRKAQVFLSPLLTGESPSRPRQVPSVPSGTSGISEDEPQLQHSFVWVATEPAADRDYVLNQGGELKEVDSYTRLLWEDFGLHWVCVTQLKILLDMFVCISFLRKWKSWHGPVAICGLLSGFLSVYRVWTYGR